MIATIRMRNYSDGGRVGVRVAQAQQGRRRSILTSSLGIIDAGETNKAVASTLSAARVALRTSRRI